MSIVFTVHIYNCEIDDEGVAVFSNKDIALRDVGAAIADNFEEATLENRKEIYDLLVEHRYQEALDLFNESNENITIHLIEHEILDECEHPNLDSLKMHLGDDADDEMDDDADDEMDDDADDDADDEMDDEETETEAAANAIAFYFVSVTHHSLKPSMVKCKSEDEALKLAQSNIADGTDPYEVSFSCMTVYDDGTCEMLEWSVDELTDKEE